MEPHQPETGPAVNTERPVRALLAASLARLRGSSFNRAEAAGWTRDTRIDGDGLGADSLELVDLAATVAECFGLTELGLDEWLLRRRTVGGWTDLTAEALAAAPTPVLTFRTSGTTGDATRHTHPLDRLRAEAACFASRSQSTRRVVAVVPAGHLYGFVHTVLLPACLRVPVFDAEHTLPARLVASLEPGDLVVATPLGWSRIEQAGGDLIPGVAGISSGQPMPTDLWARLSQRGLAELTDVYGSTETAAVAVRRRPDEPFEMLERWSRADADAFRDRLEWTGPRRFRLLGRLDDIVQVGGVNVSTGEIASRLETCPLVARCAVRRRAGAAGRLKAFVVPASQADDPAAVRAAVFAFAASLEAPARPVTITLGAALPINHMGKPADWDDSQQTPALAG